MLSGCEMRWKLVMVMAMGVFLLLVIECGMEWGFLFL